MAKIRLPYPHSGQMTVRQQAKRFNFLSAGRRWRKTTLAMSISVEAALAGKHIMWGAPTFDQVRICWKETARAVGDYAKFAQQQMVAEFPNAGSITYRSLDDPDNARGHTADGIVIDEAAEVKEEAWYEVMRPMLIDTGGWAWFIFTPKGRNWVYREGTAAQDKTDTAFWQIPTLGCRITEQGLERQPHPLENPSIDFAEIENIYRTVPERVFEQEILAQFVESAGGVFRRVMDAANATEQAQWISGHSYVFGVDWGKFNDFTVVTVIDATTRELVSLDRFNQIDYQVQLTRLMALYERFRPGMIVAERNAMGEPLIEQLFGQGLPVKPFITNNLSKAQAIDALALAFERSDIKILPDLTLIGELQAYEAERLPSGLLRYGAPEGYHDDCVMSLAMAWYSIAHQSGYGTL